MRWFQNTKWQTAQVVCGSSKSIIPFTAQREATGAMRSNKFVIMYDLTTQNARTVRQENLTQI